MNLKTLINQSVYGTVGYISSLDDINLLEQYILYNLPVLKEFKNIIVATNYKDKNIYQNLNDKIWKKYFPNCICITSEVNRGHNFGTADLDNMVFDYCKQNDIKWLCKASNDVILTEDIFKNEVNKADFYYLNGISFEDLYKANFNISKIYNERFYPQTNFYIIDVSKCNYLNDKEYLNETYLYSLNIPNYNGKIWEYISGWSCENFLKNCVESNNLSKTYLLNLHQHTRLCEAIKIYKIGDPSHKNIMMEGICHFHYPNQQIIEI